MCIVYSDDYFIRFLPEIQATTRHARRTPKETYINFREQGMYDALIKIVKMFTLRCVVS